MVKLVKVILNKTKPIRIEISNFISYNADVISFIVMVLIASIGWTLALHVWISDKAYPFNPWVGAGISVAAISLTFLAIILLLDFFSEIACNKTLILYLKIWLIGGFMAMVLFNPWLSGYTVPPTILAAKAIIALVTPIFLTIGVILALALSAVLIGATVGLAALACLAFIDACEWLTNLIVKIACAIFFDNRLLVFFGATTGAIIGHLVTGNPLFCLWGGFLGMSIAWLLLFWRWSILIRNPRLSYEEIFKRCNL
jgi:hypothetical protein